MSGLAPRPIAALSGLPCPRCGERGLGRVPDAAPPVVVGCSACGAELDAVAEVTVIADLSCRVGGCCAGFQRHRLLWRVAQEDAGETPFETWPQDCVMLGEGNRVTLLFGAGEAPRGPTRHPPMPLMVADHTTGQVWSLAGSVPVRALRTAG